MSIFRFNPLFRKRLKRFRQLKRAWWSLLLLLAMYLLTLGAELFCNTRPLAMRHEGRWYFPAFRFYPESAFLPDGSNTRPDYLQLARLGVFQHDFVLWAPVRNDPYRIVSKEEISGSLRETVRLFPEPRVAGLTLRQDLTLSKATGRESLLPPQTALSDCTGKHLGELWRLPADLQERLAPRWQGQAVDSLSVTLEPLEGTSLPPVELVFAASGTPRPQGRGTLRARALELLPPGTGKGMGTWQFPTGASLPSRNRKAFENLPGEIRQKIKEGRAAIAPGQESSSSWECQITTDRTYKLTVEREAARFPFRPLAGHWFGIDNAGRDVFARIFYGLRIALNFGMLLVAFSLAGGTFAGILQGYRGGLTDLACQRFIEIWSALPFLYVMILMGSIYGAGFMLLLVCYALFNWISISYYMRAETLRLRKQPFVEAARCIGLSGWTIAFRHILPNALVPLITLFPFSLVGAIGSLAALDYLGFGLPVPSPSLGELLSQAQGERAAWWLTLYPSLALFLVMLLGVFVGEGIRNAFDPRRQQRLQ
ncbi:MAG: ABC transporter permease subunit [Lentisphaeria bacterium]|nr:ABC transporter permease subunit [Lentisphaeria bacterium]